MYNTALETFKTKVDKS